MFYNSFKFKMEVYNLRKYQNLEALPFFSTTGKKSLVNCASGLLRTNNAERKDGAKLDVQPSTMQRPIQKGCLRDSRLSHPAIFIERCTQ